MTSDEAYQCEFCTRYRGRALPCASTTFAGCGGLHAQPRCATACALMPEVADGIEIWFASYVRTRLRAMASEAFSISRHTADCVAKKLHEQFLVDVDVVLQRILAFAALRFLYEGSPTTVTLDDVRVALCSAASARR